MVFSDCIIHGDIDCGLVLVYVKQWRIWRTRDVNVALSQ